MIDIERTVTTDRPAEAVFAYLSDFANATEWDDGTVACERVGGDGGPGTRYLNTSRFLGRETTLEYVVQELAVPTTFRIQGRNATVTSSDTITVLTGAGSSTKVTYRAVFEFHGRSRWVEPLLRLPLRRLADRTERTLSEALDRLR